MAFYGCNHHQYVMPIPLRPRPVRQLEMAVQHCTCTELGWPMLGEPGSAQGLFALLVLHSGGLSTPHFAKCSTEVRNRTYPSCDQQYRIVNCSSLINCRMAIGAM